MEYINTTLLGLLGNPVEHSLSPLMQNSAINRMRLNYVYLPFKVEPQHLANAVAAIRALNMGGVNVTVPFKEKVIPYLDELSRSAQNCGAVNLIKNENGHLIGYNTDGQGFIRSLAEQGIIPQGRVVVIGAGGAARAVAYEISNLNVEHIDFLDIDTAKADHLADTIRKGANCSTIGQLMNEENFEACSIGADLIINCTAVGMYPNVEGCPVKSLDHCQPGTVVCDLIYNPIHTRFLLMAQAQGMKTVGGLSMLVHQGVLSLEILTGHTAPVAYMKEVVFSYYEDKSRLYSN